MTDKHDQLIKAAADMVTAGRRLKKAQEELGMASVAYGIASAHFKAVSDHSPVKPVITDELPVVHVGKSVRQLLESI